MKKSLIAVLIVLSLLLAVAVGVVVYMESKANEDPAESTPGTTESTPADTQQNPSQQETETETIPEATVGISLPTEDPDEVGPAYTWPEGETGPAETAAPGDPDATYDPDENEAPPMGV